MIKMNLKMLGRVVPGIGGRVPAAPVSNLRQASDTRRRNAPAAASKPPDIDGYQRLDVAQQPVVSDVSEVKEWKSIIGDLLTGQDLSRCVALDMGLKEVTVIGTPDFFGSGAISLLRGALARRGFEITDELTCAQEVIQQIRRKSESQSKREVSDADRTSTDMYRDLVALAHALDGSDIHCFLDQDTQKARLRLRIDGIMRDWKTLEYAAMNAALAAGYHALNVKGTNSSGTWITERPINVMTRSLGKKGTPLNGRLATQPAAGGLKVVIRISDASDRAIENAKLYKLGFTEQQIQEEILPALRRTKGFVIVSGSTGDGKSTTLQHMILEMENREEKVVVTVEDPVELKLPADVTQVSVARNPDDPPEDVARKFNSALINQLRQDPDVILQGEVRDRVSAEFAAEAMLTGHLLLMSFHADSAIDSLQRLTEEKIDLPVSILSRAKLFGLVMAQKLLPLVCTHCRVPAESVMSTDDLAMFRDVYKLSTKNMRCFNPAGCDHCKRATIPANGRKGRTVAAEIIGNPTEDFLECVKAKDWKGAELAWRRTRRAAFDDPDMRGKTAFEHGLYSVSQGLVDPRSLQAVFPDQYRQPDVVQIGDSDRLKLVSNMEATCLER